MFALVSRETQRLQRPYACVREAWWARSERDGGKVDARTLRFHRAA